MRDWLEKHKVYFQVVAAILLSIMSVVVGYLQYLVADEQLRLDEYDHRPYLTVKQQTVANGVGPAYNVLEVENTGGHVRSFTCRLEGILTVGCKPVGTIGYGLRGLYDYAHASGSSVGMLQKYIIERDSRRDEYFLGVKDDEYTGASTWLIRQRRLLVMKYVDFRGRQHSVAYELHPKLGVLRISAQKLRELRACVRDSTLYDARHLDMQMLADKSTRYFEKQHAM